MKYHAIETIRVKGYPIGFVTDAHNAFPHIDSARAKHPEVKQWFFLGDIFDFINPMHNGTTAKWLEANIKNYTFLLGNHDLESAKRLLSIDYYHKQLINDNFYINVKLELLNGKNLLLCHSKPESLWDFVNAGYTEQEFDNDFGEYINERTIACVQGHGYKELIHNFQNNDTQIWSLGAIKDKRYAIFDGEKLEFKKL